MDAVLKRLSLAIIISVSPLQAAITRTGSCSATATSCTFSATSTADLKIIFAFDNGSRTIPTVPSGWTNADLGNATTTGGTVAAEVVGCNVSSSSADTGSGTWTSATAGVGISYSGTNVTTTAACRTSGLGTINFGNAKTSATANYFSLSSFVGTVSWVAGLMGGTSPSTCTPSGMTSVSATGAVRGNDTNAVVSSWATTGCTVTSETWMSDTLEILGVPPVVTCALSTALLGVGCR